MKDKEYFSQFYSERSEKFEDTVKFRNRIIMFLHDIIQKGSPQRTRNLCRAKLGINIPIVTIDPIRRSYLYNVEEAFNIAGIKVSEILDFISVVYDSWEECKKNNPIFNELQTELIQTINEIFHEESMCYEMNEFGRIRYYPDKEFSNITKATLLLLNKPKYSAQLTAFNKVLDSFYEKRNTESPVRELHSHIEFIILSITPKEQGNIINQRTIDSFKSILKTKSENSTKYKTHDIEALSLFPDEIMNWNKMCHKYRHGKPNETEKDVPPEIYNYIFSKGITIYRFLLQLDEKINLLT